MFYINVFIVGGCLVSCLTFRPFLTLDSEQLVPSKKKKGPTKTKKNKNLKIVSRTYLFKDYPFKCKQYSIVFVRICKIPTSKEYTQVVRVLDHLF